MSHRESSRYDYYGYVDTSKKTGLKKLWSNLTANIPYVIRREFGKISAHLEGMATDFTQTFKPYPVISDVHFKAALKKDAKQIFEGLKTIVGLKRITVQKRIIRERLTISERHWETLGLALIIKAPFALLWNTGKGFNYGFGYGLKYLPIHLGVFVGRVLAGAVGLVRGATQIAAYPLTLVLKIPLRLLLTAIARRKHRAAMQNVTPQEDADLGAQSPFDRSPRVVDYPPAFDPKSVDFTCIKPLMFDRMPDCVRLSQTELPAQRAHLVEAALSGPQTLPRPRLGSGSSDA